MYGSEVTNGDKLVLNKLDDQISIIDTNNDADEIDEIEYKKVSIDYTGLLDKNCSQDNILKDLLDLPLKNASKVITRPGVQQCQAQGLVFCP